MIFEEQNEARTTPQQYVVKLKYYLSYFEGNQLCVPNEDPVLTREGEEGYRKAISFLEGQKPLEPLVWSEGIARAATDHAGFLNTTGQVGHMGENNTDVGRRIGKYGEWKGHIGENNEFGSSTAQRVIVSLIVDDGSKSKARRKTVFGPYKFCGLHHERHSKHRYCTVINYAESFVPSSNLAALPPASIPRQPYVSTVRGSEMDKSAARIFDEQNKARSDPKMYTKTILKFEQYITDTELRIPGELAVQLKEGSSAFQDANAFLLRTNPIPHLRWSEGLARAAAESVNEIVNAGPYSDSRDPEKIAASDKTLAERIQKYGTYKDKVQECIVVGYQHQEEIIMHLIVSDGEPTRTQRMCVFGNYSHCGIACAPHSSLRQCTVLIYATDFTEVTLAPANQLAQQSLAQERLDANEIVSQREERRLDYINGRPVTILTTTCVMKNGETRTTTKEIQP